jgi:moderate conductance mechanosensitive channel
MRVGLAAALLTLVWSPDHAHSQAEPDAATSLAEVLGTVPEGLSGDQIDAIVSVLDDTQAREALRSSLALVAGPPPLVEEPLLARARERLGAVLAAIPQLPELIERAADRDAALGLPGSPARAVISTLLVVLAALVAAGAARFWVVRRLAAGPDARPGQAFMAFVADLIAIVTFAAVVIAIYMVLAPANPRAPALLQDILTVICIALAAGAVARLILAPTPAGRRWLVISDTAAVQVWRSVRLLLVVTLVFALPVMLATALGLPDDVAVLARLILSIAVIATAIGLVWTHRGEIAAAFVDMSASGGRHRAVLYAATLTLCLLVVWALWAIGQLTAESGVALQALASLLVVFILPLAVRWIDRLLPKEPEVDVPSPHAPVAAEPTSAVARTLSLATARRSMGRIVRVVLVLVALWAVLRIWGVDPTEGEGLLPALMAILLRGGVVVVVGYMLWLMVKGWLDRQIVTSQAASPSTSVARMATLLPIVRAFLLAVIAVVVVLSVLSSFGVDIGPLLAGAGVLGLAIGFGAQSLVKDIVSGFFFLLDDAFRIGEYVDTGSLKGTVEGMSLRSLRLRHHRGAVHTLPFGQIDALTNYSRDWVIDKLEFAVTLDTDIAKVKQVIKQVGREMAADPELAAYMIEPLKSQGIGRLTEFAAVVMAKFMAKPGQQFTIRREAYRRIMAAFKANGIRIAYPTVTIGQTSGDGPTEAELAAARLAATPPPTAA